MKAQEIKSRFVDFFIRHGHRAVESSSLIPHNDPTLLFANAGMNQFKSYFTGAEAAPFKRAVSIQKCVRAGGKHNDLENVGHTARHHTFFEMLGNFSFGDYFKHDAIHFAWKFLTEELKISKDKLYVTVHYSDDEAAKIWHEQEGVPLDRIFRKGDKDNFWEMGEYGPCGPCTEIFYDHGEANGIPGFTPAPGKDILDDDLRYVEVWNLVFMQYEKTPEGKFNLPAPCVDTGAGLERLAAVCQGKYWNYDTDVFSPIIAQLEKVSGKKYCDNKYTSAFRVVADHIRSCTLLITDGVVPSNEGRGYVLRRIIRRAVKHLRDLEVKEVCMHKLVDSVFESFATQYQENRKNKDLAVKFLQLEEKRFLETLETGIRFLDQARKTDVKNGMLTGEAAFKLYDTYGFPIDLTQIILKDHRIDVDIKGFETCMEKRKEDSRKSWKGGAAVSDKIFYQIKEEIGTTAFVGHQQLKCQAKLLRTIEMGDQFGLVFDKTCFYGESGGQVGDKGTVEQDGLVLCSILDTQKPVDGLFVHMVSDASNLIIGETYHLAVDTELRQATEANHSATHLLQAALIKVLGTHVKQSGSSVDPERLRFDFTHTQAMTKVELQKVEDLVNQMIAKNVSIEAETMSKESALEKGATALFGEKYGDTVRVVSMGDCSTELCGGTHAKNTGSIRLFNVISESSLSTGIRRIEATTAQSALKRLSQRSQFLDAFEMALNSKGERAFERFQALQVDLKDKAREIKELKEKIQANESKAIFASVETIGSLVFKAVEVAEDMDLRQLSDLFINKYTNGVVLLYCKKNDKLSALLRRGKDVQSVDCSALLKAQLAARQGKGGGKPDMAQGSAEWQNINDLVDQIKKGLA